jgi:hypothetical protein
VAIREALNQETSMNEAMPVRAYQESRIEDEPILGPVLTLPDGRIQPLTLMERLLVRLHLTNAKMLEARYFKPANS